MRVPNVIKSPEEIRKSISSGIIEIIEEQIELMQEDISREEDT